MVVLIGADMVDECASLHRKQNWLQTNIVVGKLVEENDKVAKWDHVAVLVHATVLLKLEAPAEIQDCWYYFSRFLNLSLCWFRVDEPFKREFLEACQTR